MKKLVVLGATGGTGLRIISEALAAGHSVTALVRNAAKITTQHENLKIVEMDVTDPSKMAEHIRGCDAVLSGIGGRGGFIRPPPCSVYTDVGCAAIKAMKECGVKRFVCVHAWGPGEDNPGLPFVWRWILKPIFVKNVVKNMADFEDYLLEECMDIDFTMVKTAQLVDSDSKGEEFEVVEGQFVPNYRTVFITRQDVAKFVLRCLDTEEYNKKMISIAIK